jgi:hypothetical protein
LRWGWWRWWRWGRLVGLVLIWGKWRFWLGVLVMLYFIKDAVVGIELFVNVTHVETTIPILKSIINKLLNM